MQRRQFIYGAAGSLAATQSHRLMHPVYASQPFQCRAYLPNGEPLPEASLTRLYFLTLDDEPLPNPERTVADGLLVSHAPPQWPVAIALQLPVDGFGDVTVYADNRGQGFMPGDFPLVLNRVFACDRIARITRTLSNWQAQGYRFAATISQTLAAAQALVHQAEHHDTLSGRVRLWNDALSQALWAGEHLALSRARQRIARGEPRLSFKFGCNAFGYPSSGPNYDRYFTDLFNYATVPFYWRSFETDQGNPRFDRVDRQVTWLESAGITAKGHPLAWFHDIGVPSWIREQPYHRVKQSLRQRILEIVRHYQDRIPYYDVINEAHGVPWGNELNYDSKQFLDLTRMACDVVREANPNVQRVVNSCCLWARQVALFGPSVQSPFQYVKACLRANIPFEVIGLQLYYPDQDMFEIDRMLDRFAIFGKPIHITEMSASSKTGIDESSLLGEARGLWHAPWSETVQANWVEQIYTLAYSKPTIEAITWWDLSDKSTFWPFGGLLNEENQPKRAYYRLQGLKQIWGLS